MSDIGSEISTHQVPRSTEKPGRGTSVFTTTNLEQPRGEVLPPGSIESYVNFIQGTALPAVALVAWNHSRNDVVGLASTDSKIRDMFFGNGAPDIVMEVSEGIDYLSQLLRFRAGLVGPDGAPNFNKIDEYVRTHNPESTLEWDGKSVDSLLTVTRAAIDKIIKDELRPMEGGERPQLTGYATMRWEAFSKHFTRRDIKLLDEGPAREEERRVMLERTERMFHDIKNPITAVRGYMQLLARSTRNGNDGNVFLDRIRAGWENLYNTCQRLSFELAPALGDTRVLGSEVAGVLGSYLRDQLDSTFLESFPPTVSTPQEIPEVVSGITCRVPIEFFGNLASQMAQNLERVSQAMRVDPERQNDGLHVGIDVRREGGFLVLRVTDNGLGFDEKLIGENKFGSHHGYNSQDIPTTGLAMKDLQGQLINVGGKIVTSNVTADTPSGPQSRGAIMEYYLPIVA